PRCGRRSASRTPTATAGRSTRSSKTSRAPPRRTRAPAALTSEPGLGHRAQRTPAPSVLLDVVRRGRGAGLRKGPAAEARDGQQSDEDVAREALTRADGGPGAAAPRAPEDDPV